MEMGGEWVHGEKNNSVFELVYPLGLVNNNTRHVQEVPKYFFLIRNFENAALSYL